MICANCRREIAEYSNFCYFCGTRQHADQPRPAAIQKRLMRSITNSRLAGVCGGFAEFLDVDPTVIRLLWVVLTIFTGLIFGILAYLVSWLIMPLAPLPTVSAPAAAPSSPQPSAPAS